MMIQNRDYSNFCSRVIFLTKELVHVEVYENPGERNTNDQRNQYPMFALAGNRGKNR